MTPTDRSTSLDSQLPFAKRLTYHDAYNYLDEANGLRSIKIGVRTPSGDEIGFITAEKTSDNRVKIKDIVVSDKFQRQGVGSELLKNLEKRLPVGTELYFQENQADEFWHTQGFQERALLDGSVEYFKSVDAKSSSEPISGSQPISLNSFTFQSANSVQGTMTYSDTNSRLLLQGLLEYRDSLERHLSQLASEYQQLERRWQAFNAVSGGDYADQFRTGWRQTDARFKTYINQSQKIKALLNERISALEALNRQESGLL